MVRLNDLMLGPLPNCLIKSVYSSPDNPALSWDLTKESWDQTKQFVESNRSVNAVWVFNFTTTISDMNNLMNLMAKNKDFLWQAYAVLVCPIMALTRDIWLFEGETITYWGVV